VNLAEKFNVAVDVVTFDAKTLTLSSPTVEADMIGGKLKPAAE
jgi:hypothetical protein